MRLKFRRYRSNKKLEIDWNSQNFNRTALLNFIITYHPKKYNCQYLEIGCQEDNNFNAISVKNKVGVDPESGGTLRLTSDKFFRDNKLKFDLIFLDGLHTYEQTKRDLLHSLDIINDGGVIVLDDFIPRNWKEDFTPRVQTNWNGDVWKAIVESRKSKDIDVYTCYADFGIGVIMKRPNRNLLEFSNQDSKSLKFEDYFHNHKNLMNIIEYEKLIEII